MKYVASYSGGKDSTAQIILAHEHKEPIDTIIFAEVMFDETISGELPEHIDFVKNVAFPKFRSWGYECRVLRAEKTYMDCFNHVRSRSEHPERNGLKYGFPMAGKCEINKRCKTAAIKHFDLWECPRKTRWYIGIAADEPDRLARLKKNQVSLLAKYNYTEEMAWELCEEYGLLSPLYSFAKRGGCWFCPNASDKELRHLRSEHPELWQKLLDLEDEPDVGFRKWNTLCNVSIHDKERQFAEENKRVVG